MNRLFFLLTVVVFAGCQVLPTGKALPSASTPLAAPSFTPSRAPSATQIPSPLPQTVTPDTLANATQTQAAWTATFQASTQAAIASQMHAEQTGIANEATADASYQMTETAVIHTLLTTVTPKVIQSSRSPDGKWLAKVIKRGCTLTRPDAWMDAYEILQIGDQVAETQHYNCGGMGAYGFAGQFWTPNSRFFYYNYTREGWPDGGYPWMPPISRYDVTTGKSETLSYAVFSPDRRMIAGSVGTDLVVWEVNSETIHRFFGLPDNPTQYGLVWAAWSPDGRSLAYVTQTFCQAPCPAALHRVDTQTWQQTQLADLSNHPMMMVVWKKAGTLELLGADFTSTWLFDLKQNTLSQVVPTLTPTPKP